MKLKIKIMISFLAAGLVPAIIASILYAAGTPLWAMIICLVAGALLIGWVMSRSCNKLLNELIRGVRIVCSGNLDYKVGTRTDDEIGELSSEFDVLAESLKKDEADIAVLSQKQIEQKDIIRDLKKQEDYYKRLFEQANDAVFIYDFEGKIIDANNKACDMLGYPRDVLLKISFYDLFTEEELVSSKEACKTGAETCSIRFESTFQKATGEAIDVEISSSVVDLRKGIMQGIVSNISGRKEMQKALEESEEKFRTFMETASDLMFIMDDNGQFIYVNEAMASSLGYDKNELMGTGFREIIHKDKLKEHLEMQKCLMKEAEATYETTWETKNRNKVYGEIKINGVYDENGICTAFRGIFRDISERKKVEESQRLSHLGKLAADVAHEVNNPITIISARAELSLMNKPEDANLTKSLTTIVEQCEAAKDIVERLLTFSKPSKGNFKEVKINDTIKSVVDLVEHQFIGNKIKIEQDLGKGLPKIKVDEKQIQEVWMNLLRNADEAMPKGGTINIKTFTEGGNVYVEVKDSGEGISEEAMKEIFDPFFTTKEKGTGLGLSVCYGIIKAHGGDLRYVSTPGEGTTAIVTLPISARQRK